ncbi:MAG TPA: ATP-binding cassette domain-containing protein, partial [Paraburkholderia sp.]
PRTAQAVTEPALQLRGLRLAPGSEAFDLEVRQGEIVAIVGPVGAGKSRLAQVIFGAQRAVAGEMHLYGQPWAPRTPADAIRAGVFLAGEDRWRTSLFPDTVAFASIAGTLSFPFLSRWQRGGGLPHKRERAEARRAIEAFDIRCEGPDDRVSRLSGGNQQKVLLARWHAEPARLLLLDEPFQGVDAGARADIAATLRRRAAGRATLVFVSELEEAHEVADRIVSFDRGAVEHDGVAETLLTN